jgi:hypothetical protein
MEASYETVVDPTTVIFSMAAYLLHGLFAGTQAAIALYLVAAAAVGLARRASGLVAAALRLLAGVALLLPVLAGVPFPVSLAGCVAALALFLRAGSGWLRRAAIPATALVLLFMIFEREDPIALGVELLSGMQQARAAEIEWQLAADRKAPKAGELAPDFALEDPSGQTRIRLSDFRGKRPVALMFGSYT